MSGFMKVAQRPKEGTEKEGASADDKEEPQAAGGRHAALASASAATGPIGPSHDASSDDDEEGEEGSAPDLRKQMVKRHQKEMQAHKKAVQRMGKKSKDELTKLNKEIEDRHAAELRALVSLEPKQQQRHEAAATKEEVGAAVQSPAAKLDELSLESDASKKPSKAMKRREKMEKDEVERQARVAEEAAALGPSSRLVEEEALEKLLGPAGLRMKDIKADGHCLYRSLEDQLSQQQQQGQQGQPSPATSTPLGYQQLREQAAAYIRAHPDDFIPFVFDKEKDGDPTAQLLAYCDEMASTAAWGGQMELGALAEILQRRIEVHAVGMPLVVMGEGHPGAPLSVCYMRHAFGLGEHYNSTQPLQTEPAGEKVDDADGSIDAAAA